MTDNEQRLPAIDVQHWREELQIKDLSLIRLMVGRCCMAPACRCRTVSG